MNLKNVKQASEMCPVGAILVEEQENSRNLKYKWKSSKKSVKVA